MPLMQYIQAYRAIYNDFHKHSGKSIITSHSAANICRQVVKYASHPLHSFRSFFYNNAVPLQIKSTGKIKRNMAITSIHASLAELSLSVS